MSLKIRRPITSLHRCLIHTRPSSPPSSSLSLLQTRSKHSNTQVKRLFKNNPANLRILARRAAQQVADAPNTDTDGAAAGDASNNIPTRTYKPVFRPKFLSNGWSAPPGPEVEIPNYPFFVGRTGNKPFGAEGFLPVYKDVRVHGTKYTTIIRNVSGDIPAFLTELQAVLKLPPPKKILNTYATGGTGSHRPNAARHGGGEAGRGVCKENPIRIRAGGTIEVHGNVVRSVKSWLAGLGF